MMGSLGHGKEFGQFLKVRMHGFPAWFIRRIYYLLQVPGWGRKLRILIDWTFALLFRPDVVKVGLDSETAALLCEVALDDAAAGPPEEDGTPSDSASDGSPLALARSANSAAGGDGRTYYFVARQEFEKLPATH